MIKYKLPACFLILFGGLTPLLFVRNRRFFVPKAVAVYIIDKDCFSVLYLIVTYWMHYTFVFRSQDLDIIRKLCRSENVHLSGQVHDPSGHDNSRPPNVFIAIEIFDYVYGTCIKAYTNVDSVFFRT